MFRYKNISVKNKLILMQLLTAGIVLATYAVFLILSDINYYKNRLENQISAQIKVTGVNSIPAIEFNDAEAAKENLNALLADHTIIQAWITDDSGKLFSAHSSEQADAGDFSPTTREFQEYQDGFLIMARKIKQGNQIYGYIAAKIDTSEHNDFLFQKTILTIALMLGGLLLAYGIASIMQEGLSNPIRKLTNIVNNVAETKDLTFTFTTNMSDEIGVLSSGLNNMLAEINKLNSELEQRVKERTAELEDQRNRFRNLTVNLPAMIYQAESRANSPVKFTYLSPKMHEFYEIDDEVDDPTTVLFDRVHPDDREELIRSNQAAIDNIEPWYGTHRIVVPSGNTYWVEGASNPVKQANGIVLWDGLLLDITDRKLSEEKLKKSESRLEEAQRIAHIGNWDWANDYNSMYMSNEVFQILGVSKSDRSAYYDVLINAVHPDDRPTVEKTFKNALQKQESFYLEHRIRLPNNETRYVAQKCRIEVEDGETEPRIYGTIQDITDRHNFEQELKESHDSLAEANIQLRNADRIKSIFLASMSHELRTPLNSIIGFTSIMLQGMVGELTEEQKKQLAMVKKSANHLLELINEVLDISKIEAEQIDLELMEFNLSEVIDEVVGNLGNIANQKNIKLSSNGNANFGVFTDKRRIKQVLFNLIGNGIKFTDEGDVVVKTTLLDNNKFEIRVSDSGIGIKDEDLVRLFHPFQQVDDSLTKKYEGTGLGLYLSKKLVNLLGGTIRATSTYGEGSTFIVILPCKCEVKKGYEKNIGD